MKEKKESLTDYIKKTMFLVGALSSVYLSATFRFLFVDEMFLDIINLKKNPKQKITYFGFLTVPRKQILAATLVKFKILHLGQCS